MIVTSYIVLSGLCVCEYQTSPFAVGAGGGFGTTLSSNFWYILDKKEISRYNIK